MSGITLLAKNANFQLGAVGFVPAVARGLKGLYLFGSNSSGLNVLTGQPLGVATGVPVAQTVYSSRLGPAAYIDSGIAETADMTIFAVARRYSGGALRQVYAGNWTGRDAANTINIQGFGTVVEADGGLTTVAASYSGVAGAASSANGASLGADGAVTNSIDTGPWRALVSKVDTTGTGLRYARDKTLNTTATTAMTGGNVRDLRNTSTLRVGYGGASVAGLTTCELMMVAIANVAWTDTEEATFYAWAKAYAARRGIAI